MPKARNAIQETITEWAKQSGAGLLGKITPFFLAALVFGATAMGTLPEEVRIYGFIFGVGVAVVYSLLAGFIILVHPILGAMDGDAARRALRDKLKASKPQIIQGQANPVSLDSPQQGIAGSSALSIENGRPE